MNFREAWSRFLFFYCSGVCFCYFFAGDFFSLFFVAEKESDYVMFVDLGEL